MGQPIRIGVEWSEHREGLIEPQRQIELVHPHCPEPARKHPVTAEMIATQLARLGNTPYEIGSCEVQIDGEPMIPLSVLGELRKQLIDRVDGVRLESPKRRISQEGVSVRMLDRARSSMAGKNEAESTSNAEGAVSTSAAEGYLHVLCRSLDQLRYGLESGHRKFYVEFQDIREYRSAVSMARDADAEIYLATLRIQKQGEAGLFKALAKHGADGWLVRNLAALRFATEQGIPCIADFSLNVTNPLTAEWLALRGATRVTPSYDLNRDQLLELVGQMPAEWLEVVIHQHMPMFHMEHCVFCTVLSPGTNKSNCGRPCDRHDVKLRDRIGVQHVLHADVGCRNTLYNGNAQSGAEVVPMLRGMGVKNFRVEILRDAPSAEIQRLIGLYRELIAGKLDAGSVWKSLKAENRVGVTRGTLEHPRNPLAIL